MNKYLLAAASAAALAFVASAATAAPIGYVQGAYSDSNDLDAHSWTLSGSVVVPAGPVNVQVDAAGATTRVKGAGNSEDFVGQAHVFYRNDTYAVGGVVAGFDEGLYAWGGEGAVYLSNVTLSGQVVQLRDESEGGIGNFATVVGVGGKVFATDNISVGVNYANVNPRGAGGSLDVWGVNGEYKFASAPVSVGLAYQRQDDLDIDAWTIGARWHFGAGSLKEQDRKGASMGDNLSLRTLF